MFKKVMVFAIAAMVLASMACAQEGMGLYGKNEVSFSAAWADIADVNAALVAVHYGRFVTPNLEAQAAVIWAEIDAFGDDVSAWAIAPAVSWHFIGEGTTNVVPYVGIGWYFLGLDAFGGDETENGLEAFVGAKFFIGGDYKCSNRAVFVEYRYLNDVFGENVNSVMLGITNFF